MKSLPKTMRAAILEEYGAPEVLQISSRVPMPVPQNEEILVKVQTVSATVADSRIRAARFPGGFAILARLIFGISAPRVKVLGSCFAGEVVDIGKNVKNFAVGDQVAGMMGIKMGAYAEYLTILERGAVVKKPATISNEDASGLLFGGTTALHFLRDRAQVKPNQKVLINGASGAVGTNAVQLAKYSGAEVTAVCSGDNFDLVKSLGADHLIDYTKENFLQKAEKYDVIMDCVGNISFAEGKSTLTPQGKLMLVVASLGQIISANFASSANGQQVITSTADEKKEDIEFLLQLLSEGKLKVVISKIYPLSQVVEAHKYIDTGRKVGNVVVQVD